MNTELVALIWRRAHGRCEYCRLAENQSILPFQIDHIIARKHGGRTSAKNLALACYYCNSFKGPNIGGLDPRSGRLTQLFNPRRHHWRRCFRWRGARLIGRTPIGRTTIAVLCVNNPQAISFRQALIDEGAFPPT